MNSPAGSDANIHRGRRRWGRKVLRQWCIRVRWRDIGVDSIGNVGAPAHGDTPADACADVGVGHTGRLYDGIHLRNRGKGQYSYRPCSPRPHPPVHQDLLTLTGGKFWACLF